ncbi:MAG: hypothetical protein U1F61_07115 [Opitutaceae bacterium]
MKSLLRLSAFLIGAWAFAAPPGPSALQNTRVLLDEIVTTTTSPRNGSSPMWSVGAPLVVRENGRVWTSISVHDPEALPYCNTHWELWRLTAQEPWSRIRKGPVASEREPCPLFLPDPGSLALSIHPKILERGPQSGGEMAWHCQPALAVFDPNQPERDTQLWRPPLDTSSRFTQHSYRSVGVDSVNRSLLLMVIDHNDAYHAAWRDGAGTWRTTKPPSFPIRACYPNVAIRNRTGHVLAIGDITEPMAAWKAEKLAVLGRGWDYVFRRLFYSWTSDLSSEAFREPVEIDTVDDTAGWMFNLDLLIDARGRVHLLWVRRTFDHGFLGDRFFPGRPNVESLMHAVVDQGRLVASEPLARRILPRAAPGDRNFTSGRLHELPDGRLVAILVAPTPSGSTGLFLQELDPEARASSPPVLVPLKRPPPPSYFFTNTPRGGSSPDPHIDFLGAEEKGDTISLRYIQLLLP